MLNEYNTLNSWIQSKPQFSDQSSTLVLWQTYQEWLNEHFNSQSTFAETRSM